MMGSLHFSMIWGLFLLAGLLASVRGRVHPGEPLFLTPLIEAGHIHEAQQLSLVLNLDINITSYSGFLTVDKEYNSNMFFWFFPAMKAPKSAPILLWLQGGPGGSSLLGLFVLNGPIKVTKDLKLALRDYSWATPFSVLYIDNPVGAGFSFTKDDAGYARDEKDVANGLYSALLQFFTLFPEYQQNDFYITGESYAGKYIPAIAHKIHQERPSTIRMKGIAIGDGLIDPETMLDNSDYLFQLGLLDELQRDYMKSQMLIAQEYIRQKSWSMAFTIYNDLMLGFETGSSFFENCTGFSNNYNVLYTVRPEDQRYFKSYVTKSRVRKSIHVGNLRYHSATKIKKQLYLNDFMQSVKPWLSTLMDNYKVLIYSGQMDILVAYPLTAKFLQTVQWNGAEQYKNAQRQIWKVAPSDVEVAGYVRQVGDFYQVLVRNAGHMVPYDQPLCAYDMMVRFVNGKSFAN